VHPEVKSFQERSPYKVGAIGIVATLGLMWVSLNYDKLPFVDLDTEYTAYFAEAGGLAAGNPVQVSGFRVGDVSSVDLEGNRVVVKFKIDSDVRLGDRSEAAIKLKSLLGAKLLEITSRGDGRLNKPIPLDRTTSPYQLPDALGDLATTISGLNTDQLSRSLSVLSDAFANTPPDLQAAVKGVARFSETLDKRDEQLRTLLENANKATTVLAERSNEVVGLVTNTNALLVQLRTQSRALDQIAGNISAVAQEVKGFIADNRQTLRPALDKLNNVLTIVDNRKERLQKAIKGLNGFALSLGESVASGPYFKAYLANLVPGQFLQPFIDVAFSDLGLDPNVLLPSQLTDPQTGQRATPPLPMPYPRTGQGGDPRLTLPDAISGNPDDHQCGPAGIPLPGPGCYPLRPGPAPGPPGGPPPGPPALTAPGPGASVPTPPGPFEQPAPGQASPAPPTERSGP